MDEWLYCCITSAWIILAFSLCNPWIITESLHHWFILASLYNFFHGTVHKNNLASPDIMLHLFYARWGHESLNRPRIVGQNRPRAIWQIGVHSIGQFRCIFVWIRQDLADQIDRPCQLSSLEGWAHRALFECCATKTTATNNMSDRFPEAGLEPRGEAGEMECQVIS